MNEKKPLKAFKKKNRTGSTNRYSGYGANTCDHTDNWPSGGRMKSIRTLRDVLCSVDFKQEGHPPEGDASRE